MTADSRSLGQSRPLILLDQLTAPDKSRSRERERLAQCTPPAPAWKLWGPYLSERQWGTVREDYSPHGTAWEYFPHDHARSRAYRWGEDGLLGFSDDQQLLCFSVALWNSAIRSSRSGCSVSPQRRNHGEDVQELLYYLDGSPAHSLLEMLYQYPRNKFPMRNLSPKNLCPTCPTRVRVLEPGGSRKSLFHRVRKIPKSSPKTPYRPTFKSGSEGHSGCVPH